MATSTATIRITVAGECPLPENCGCDCGYPTKTLGQLTREIAVLMGYSAQLDNLPESFVVSVREHLNLMQQIVVSDISEIANDRYFSWDVAPGEFLFCTSENRETCRNLLLATRITEVYVVRECTIIERLKKGIPFALKSGGNPGSIPSRYEVRSCIEIWPKPTEAMRLVVKGTLAAVDMEDPTDVCMVDPKLLKLRTIAFLKAAKGHPDANNYMGQYDRMVGDLAADSHEDMRYIPGTTVSVDDERLTRVMDPLIYRDAP